jgi:hypothetical protein
MTEDARTAKAEAKAMKAKAKALRPWYMKKRIWLLGAVVIIIGAAVASGGGDTSTDTASSSSGNSGISSGLGSKDATADIQDFDCGVTDIIGVTYPSVTVKNNSSKASNYVIEIVFESADGSTKYDETSVFISNLQPGQTMTEKGIITNDLPSGTVCFVSEVQRTAA